MTLWLLALLSAGLYLFGFAWRFPLASHYRGLTDLGALDGHDGGAALRYLGPIAALFVLYLLGWWRARAAPGRGTIAAVYAGAVAFGLIAAAEYPITAIDMYVYLVHGRVWAAHGANPLATPASTFAAVDPLVPLAGQYAGELPPYGPLWLGLAGLPTLLFGDDLLLGLFGLKALAVLFYLGCTLAVTWILRRTRPAAAAAGTLLFAWNPLVVLDGVGNGHNDAAMMLPALVAVGLALSGRPLPSLAVLALSAGVKYASGLLLPVLFLHFLRRQPDWPSRLRFTAAAGLVTGGVLAASYAPFWAGRATFDGLLKRNDLYLGSAAAALDLLRKARFPELSAEQLTLLLTAGFGLFYLVQLARLWLGRADWRAVGFDVLFGAMFAPTWFNSWFVIWPLALAAIQPVGRIPWRAVTLSATVMLGAFFFYFKPVWDPAGWGLSDVHVVASPAMFLPPLLLSLWPRWRRRPGAADRPTRTPAPEAISPREAA